MFEKNKIKKAYVEALNKKLQKARKSYEVAKNDTIEAEGRMVTRYDSTKTETAWLADGCLKEVKELEQCIDDLQNSKPFADISDIVFVDLIINKEYQKTEKYLLSKTENDWVPEKLLDTFLGSTVGDVFVLEENRQYIEYQVEKIEKGSSEGIISIESMVTLRDEYGDEELYYIVNYIGGMTMEVDGKEIFCISKHTPLAKKMLGRKIGEKVEISEGVEMYIVGLEK